MENIIEKVRKELIAVSDDRTKESGLRFFREEVRLYGCRSSDVGRIARENYRIIGRMDKDDILALCETLWQSGMMEESFVACSWAERQVKDFTPEDFQVLERWVKRYLSNWASCDTLCNHTVGEFIMKYPSFTSKLKEWTESENRWVKRASAVSLIIPARKGLFHDEILEIARLLLTDGDDMVQKGYGWMLKSASQANLGKIFGFVMENKSAMPRTALRYAIEKMPAEMKREAMAR